MLCLRARRGATVLLTFRFLAVTPFGATCLARNEPRWATYRRQAATLLRQDMGQAFVADLERRPGGSKPGSTPPAAPVGAVAGGLLWHLFAFLGISAIM